MKDFMGMACFDTMKELAEFFGFEAPKEEERSLYEQHICRYKRWLPLNIYAHKDIEVFDGSNARDFSSDDKAYHFKGITNKIIDESTKIILTTCFDALNSIASEQDISELFELSDDTMRVFIRGMDAISLLKNPDLLAKLQKYVKMLTEALKYEAQSVLKKKFTKDDILKYLKENPKQARFVKECTGHDLRVLREHRPEMLANWEYYQDFLKLCDDLPQENEKNSFVPLTAADPAIALALMDKSKWSK